VIAASSGGSTIETRRFNEEVLFTAQDLTIVSAQEIAWLKEQAAKTRRGRIRLCAHRETDAPVHEMLIVHPGGAYVRPHKHLNKEESLHLIEGFVTLVVFNDDRSVRQVVPMGAYASGRSFYYRLAANRYHTLLIESDVVVFHEAIRGPFSPADMLIAPWAPDEDDVPAVKQFLEQIREEAHARVL